MKQSKIEVETFIEVFSCKVLKFTEGKYFRVFHVFFAIISTSQLMLYEMPN